MVQALQQQVAQLEMREQQLEEQGRQNEEKVMHELAVKIKAIEQLKIKLEESNQLVKDRTKTVQELSGNQKFMVLVFIEEN